jgi:hypothetical protein
VNAYTPTNVRFWVGSLKRDEPSTFRSTPRFSRPVVPATVIVSPIKASAASLIMPRDVGTFPVLSTPIVPVEISAYAEADCPAFVKVLLAASMLYWRPPLPNPLIISVASVKYCVSAFAPAAPKQKSARIIQRLVFKACIFPSAT